MNDESRKATQLSRLGLKFHINEIDARRELEERKDYLYS